MRELFTDEWVAELLDAVVELDPVAKAGIERTDGFLTRDELVSRLAWEDDDRPSPS